LRWAIITGEYPPQRGGVSDYTCLLAEALVGTGDEVHVWAPACTSSAPENAGVAVHRLSDKFGLRGLAQLSAGLSRLPRPYRILVQYVPQAFGWKAMNLPFCVWLWSRRRTPVWVMFHEVVFPLNWSQPFHHKILGVMTRVMAYIAARSAERIFTSILAWQKFVQPLARQGQSLNWLPIPSTVPTEVNPQRVESLRAQMVQPGESLVGYFGTYSKYVHTILQATFTALLRADPRRRALLLGHAGRAFAQELAKPEPALAGRVFAPGGLPASEVSCHLAACDLLVQPYPDGISSRRTSSMAGLALGIPIVTNEGPLSEPLWRESGAVSLARDDSAQELILAAEEVLSSRLRQAELRCHATSLYQQRFAVEHVVALLRSEPRALAAPCRGSKEY